MNFTEFTNADGKKISVRFREFVEEDAAAIVNLIREEYSDKYQNKNLYDKDFIIQSYKDDKIIFQVAELEDGEIVGCLNMQKNFPRDEYANMGTGIILKEFRQYHLFQPLIKFVMEEIYNRREVSAICAYLVMYHEITEKLIDRLGLTPCGLVPQKVLVANSQNSYAKGKNLKYTSVFAVTKVLQNDVGKIYLPVEHKNFAEKIYSALKVEREIISYKINLKGESKIVLEDFPEQKYSAIYVDGAGADLAEKISEIESARRDDLQTFNIFLNISDEKAVAAYEVLRGLGYFFAGFKPLGGTREVMILHNPKKVEINFEELKATDHYLPLKNYVRKCYDNR